MFCVCEKYLPEIILQSENDKSFLLYFSFSLYIFKFTFQMISSLAICPKFLIEYDKLFDDLQLQKFYNQYQSMFEYIKNYSHLEMGKKAMASTTLLCDVLSVEVNLFYN